MDIGFEDGAMTIVHRPRDIFYVAARSTLWSVYVEYQYPHSIPL